MFFQVNFMNSEQFLNDFNKVKFIYGKNKVIVN